MLAVLWSDARYRGQARDVFLANVEAACPATVTDKAIPIPTNMLGINPISQAPAAAYTKRRKISS
jgi:hypothetical protein